MFTGQWSVSLPEHRAHRDVPFVGKIDVNLLPGSMSVFTCFREIAQMQGE